MKKLIFILLCFSILTFGSSARIIEVAPAGAWGVLGISGGGAVAAGGTLIDTNLVVRYFFDEAASGTTPTDVLDASGVGSDFDLAINYGTSDAAYTEVSGNRVWEITDETGGPVARLAINDSSDKIRDAIHGAQKATIELVVNVTAASTSAGRLFGITGSGDEGALMVLHDNTVGTFRSNETENIGSFTWTKSERAVWHFVVDTTLATAGDRIKIYKNGSDTSIALDISPDQNTTFVIEATSFLVVGNRANDGTRGVAGEYFYAALYSGAFSAQDCSDNYDVLTADDDQ